MKLLAPCVLGILIALPAFNPPAGAAAAGVRPSYGQPTDVSSTNRKRRHSTRSSVPSTYAAQPGWHGADPSFGPGTAQMRAYQRQGRCVIDEGYGRYTFCDNY